MVIELKEHTNNTPSELMTFKQACEYLGLSQSYLYKLTSKKFIKHYKPRGKLIYFRKSEIDKWVFDKDHQKYWLMPGKRKKQAN